MKIRISVILVFLITVPLISGQTNSWEELTPLRSTRHQVEKLFGKPNAERSKYVNEYKVGEDSVQVEYSKRTCDQGWNVPIDTVLSFRVSDHEKVGKNAEQLGLDEKKFFISRDDALFGTWTEPIIGIQYEFTHVRMFLDYVKYIPRREDNELRCDGFPPYEPEAYYFTMDSSVFHDPKRNKTDDKLFPAASLDNALIQTRNNPGYRLYVLIYFDDKLSLKEYRKRVDYLKNLMFIQRKAKADEVTFVEAGMREENYMELHIIPKDWKAPAPKPTLPSPQFLRTKSATRSNSPKT